MTSEASPASTLDLPALPAGWSWHLLRDLVDAERGICYGIVQPGTHDENGVPMVNTGDVFDGHVRSTIGFRVSTHLHERFRRSTLRGGEILVTLVGANFGRVAVAPPHYAGSNCSRAVGVVPVIGDADYVMFALRSPLARHFMDIWANTTAQPTFNLKELGNLPIPVPPVAARYEIKTFLKSLDDRFALLRETNATLEAIAQALFKSWFVDFDPVHAKQQGIAPAGMDEATAALFPDSFEESVLGLVPKGWQVKPLNALSKISGGKRPVDRSDTETSEVRTPLYGGAGLMGFTSESLFDTSLILTGRVGTLGKTCIAYPPFWASDNALVLSPLESCFFHFCFHWLKSIDVLALNRGSTQPLLTQRDLGNQQHVVPEYQVLRSFARVTESIYETLRNNELRAQTLATLRDTLLPRLISGQLRLTEAEPTLETA